MRRLLSVDQLVRALVGAFSTLIVLSLLIVADVVPGELLWAARADHPADLAALERLSLAMFVIALVVTLLRRSALLSGERLKESAFGLWLISLFLVMNAISTFSEGWHATALIVAPISLALAFLTAQLALDDGDDDGH